jgi:hypothetical protein
MRFGVGVPRGYAIAIGIPVGVRVTIGIAFRICVAIGIGIRIRRHPRRRKRRKKDKGLVATLPRVVAITHTDHMVPSATHCSVVIRASISRQMIEAEKEFHRVILEDYEPWSCEVVQTIRVNVKTWVEENA